MTKELLPGQIPTEVPREARQAPISENAAGVVLPEDDGESIAFKASEHMAEMFMAQKEKKPKKR